MLFYSDSLLVVQINDHIHAGMVGFYTLEGDPIEEKVIGII